ncbi:MAG TPA: hypothetical protein VMB21_17860 [Candidatus Limnocylindria bacterium]|nr:hypothetical protein [Candidatus Limnocylindria bacterium]
MRFTLLAFLLLPLCALTLRAAESAPAPQQFLQEVTRRYGTAQGLPANDVQLLDLAADGTPRAFAGGKWSELRDGKWSELAALAPKSEREFVFADVSSVPVTAALPWASVKQIVRAGAATWLVTAVEPLLVREGKPVAQDWSGKGRVNQLAMGPDGAVWVASGAGLFRLGPKGWERQEILDGLGRAWAVNDVLGVAFDSVGRLWFATKAGVGCQDATGWKFYEGKDGLPWNDFTGLAAGKEGEMWFGTHLGAIRWDGHDFQYRQGPLWLPQDDVHGMAVNVQGEAWFATAGGVGVIARQPMTLAAKAEHYESEIEHHIKRTPFGFVAEAPLGKPADRSTATPHDSDNDGLWTSMYGAGECFAYGATQDPKAKARARQAFEALRFLQKVTQGGTPAPPKGYVARTILPGDGPDPNVGRLAGDREEQKHDVLWKAYEPRWPKSADGKWYWKSDTSSDELDGHYFFYALYFDLVADTEVEKERLREVVRDLTDHLIVHGFTLTDIDGTPTRWGVFGPQFLNRDPRWWAERGMNSLSIITYLAVAGHVTGDPKYAAISRELLDEHGYRQNLMYPKVQAGPGSGNQSDDEMAFMCFYGLLHCSQDEALKNSVRASFYAYWQNEAPELNPFFNFAYAAQGLGQSITNVWGTYPVSPGGDWFPDSMATLRGFPLDRLDWSHQNSHRLDVVPLGGTRSKDSYAPGERGRGHRVNGKVLPVENRHFGHWNTDPWELDYGGNGNELDAGTVFLLPYYMGLYHGYIAKP